MSIFPRKKSVLEQAADMREADEKARIESQAEEALADMPPFNAHGYTAEVPVMVADGLDPIQKMQLSRNDRAREAKRVYAIKHDLTPEEVQDLYIAIEMPDGSFRVHLKFKEDNRPDSEIAKEKSAIDGHRPDSNPKSALGIKKVPLHLVSPIATLHEAMAMAEGGMKYGPYNYREDAVAATVYIAACLRHIMDWAMGEDHALDSGLHHLGHARACLGILLDAEGHGSLIDDRFKSEAYSKLLREYTMMLPAMAHRIKKMAAELEAHNR